MPQVLTVILTLLLHGGIHTGQGGLLDGTRQGSIFVEMSTVSPSFIRRMTAACDANETKRTQSDHTTLKRRPNSNPAPTTEPGHAAQDRVGLGCKGSPESRASGPPVWESWGDTVGACTAKVIGE